MWTAGLAAASALGSALLGGAVDASPSDDYPNWLTRAGVPVPTSVIRSQAAYEHCWPDATILYIGNLGPLGPTVRIEREAPVIGPAIGPTDPGVVHLFSAAGYVRDPGHTYGPAALTMPYQSHAQLPDDALDTGLHQDGTALWLARDGRTAYAVSPEGVERWPALAFGVGCA